MAEVDARIEGDERYRRAYAASALALRRHVPPPGTDYHVVVAGRLVDQADLDAALEYYEDALKFGPELFPALFNSAQIYYEKENYKKASNRFRKAASIARGGGAMEASLEARALSGLGSCYQKTDKSKSAEKWFRAAIRKDPQLVEAHYNLVNLLVSQDREEEAKKALATADRLAPDIRYGIFEGRLKGKEGQEVTKAVAGKVAIVAVIALLLMYSFYLRLAKKRAGR